MQILTLEQWRIRAGMNQKQLSDKSGVDRTLINKLEAGKRKTCEPSNMLSLSQALGVAPEQVAEFIPMLQGKGDLPNTLNDREVYNTAVGAGTPTAALIS